LNAQEVDLEWVDTRGFTGKRVSFDMKRETTKNETKIDRPRTMEA